jgi:hypothetical protein
MAGTDAGISGELAAIREEVERMMAESVAIEAQLATIGQDLAIMRDEREGFGEAFSHDEHEAISARLAELDDETLVWAVLVSVKMGEDGRARKARQVATFAVGELLRRFVPGDAVEAAYARYLAPEAEAEDA